jgi:UDP-N-acetylglucosamine transferase subunit ALG13
MKCFVTVGSTQFEQLIFTICEEGTLQNLSQIGIDNLVIQNGSGKLPECFDEGTNYVDDLWEAELAGLKVGKKRAGFLTNSTFSDQPISLQKFHSQRDGRY